MMEKRAPKIVSHIREHRERLGLTQEDLARAAGCTLGTVGSLERGESAPTLFVAVRIADALGMDVRDLFQSR